MAQLYTNNAKSTLASPILAGALSMTVASGEGSRFPSPTSRDYFLATLIGYTGAAESSWEIVKVTARSGDVMTIQRAQEGTTALGWAATTPVELRFTAATAASYGLNVLPQNSQSTNYTCVLADAGWHILHPSADTTARTFTIPANASVAYPIGTTLTFINQNGAGALTIAITSDTLRVAGTGATGSRTLYQNGLATAIKLTATEWIISGTNLV